MLGEEWLAVATSVSQVLALYIPSQVGVMDTSIDAPMFLLLWRILPLEGTPQVFHSDHAL